MWLRLSRPVFGEIFSELRSRQQIKLSCKLSQLPTNSTRHKQHQSRLKVLNCFMRRNSSSMMSWCKGRGLMERRSASYYLIAVLLFVCSHCDCQEVWYILLSPINSVLIVTKSINSRDIKVFVAELPGEGRDSGWEEDDYSAPDSNQPNGGFSSRWTLGCNIKMFVNAWDSNWLLLPSVDPWVRQNSESQNLKL